MLATLNDVMKIAEEKKIAVGSFNTPNLEALQAVIEAAEELDLPVIIQFAQCHEPWIPLAIMVRPWNICNRHLIWDLHQLCMMDPHFPMKKIWRIQKEQLPWQLRQGLR